MTSPPAALALVWRRRAAEPAVSAALESIYSRTHDAITHRGPACWASGRCCNFDQAGHRLYVTGIEAAYAIIHKEPTAQAVEHFPVSRADPGSIARAIGSLVDPSDTRTLSLTQIDLARSQGGCPFQVHNLCGIHAVKPLGCRVYFCDRSAQDWQHDLSEDMLREVRALHDRFDIEYRYAEWRTMLEYFAH